MNYDLELERLQQEVERADAQQVLIQLPDGLKPSAKQILQFMKERFPKTKVVFWAGSCFGACDAPLHVRSLRFDLLVQFGHAPWRY